MTTEEETADNTQPCMTATVGPASRLENTPRIYVASLADYNSGRLHGCWIDACQPLESIQQEIHDMLAESKEPIAEEWAIHDYENFGGLSLSEFENLEHVAEVARLMSEHGPVFAELVGHFGGASNIEEAQCSMEQGYCGAYENLAEYAEQFIEDCCGDVIKNVPEFIRYHIDYDGIGQDMELGGDIFTVLSEGMLHVFDAHV